jgi:hypothetical protein
VPSTVLLTAHSFFNWRTNSLSLTFPGSFFLLNFLRKKNWLQNNRFISFFFFTFVWTWKKWWTLWHAKVANVFSGLYYKHITIVNDDTIMMLQVVASPTIVILTTLEVSFMLLANIYSGGVTHDDCHVMIVIYLMCHWCSKYTFIVEVSLMTIVMWRL